VWTHAGVHPFHRAALISASSRRTSWPGQRWAFDLGRLSLWAPLQTQELYIQTWGTGRNEDGFKKQKKAEKLRNKRGRGGTNTTQISLLPEPGSVTQTVVLAQTLDCSFPLCALFSSYRIHGCSASYHVLFVVVLCLLLFYVCCCFMFVVGLCLLLFYVCYCFMFVVVLCFCCFMFVIVLCLLLFYVCCCFMFLLFYVFVVLCLLLSYVCCCFMFVVVLCLLRSVRELQMLISWSDNLVQSIKRWHLCFNCTWTLFKKRSK